LLDKVLAEVGIPREETYVTNAVKHFKWTPRGKRRLHATPTAREVTACKPWLEAEVQALGPQMIVALGATAARALFGNQFRVTQQRGKPIKSPLAPWCMATVHPSALLRAPAEFREQAIADFTADLRTVARHLQRISAA
jgi:DNA polymerase